MNIDDVRVLLSKLMYELVPTEEYRIVVEEEEGQLKLEIITESKRAIVAWAEISYAFEKMVNTQYDQNIVS